MAEETHSEKDLRLLSLVLPGLTVVMLLQTFGYETYDIREAPAPSPFLFIEIATIGHTDKVQCVPAYEPCQEVYGRACQQGVADVGLRQQQLGRCIIPRPRAAKGNGQDQNFPAGEEHEQPSDVTADRMPGGGVGHVTVRSQGCVRGFLRRSFLGEGINQGISGDDALIYLVWPY